MTNENVRLQYIKNVLGIKSVIVPENYEPLVIEERPLEFSFQTFNQGQVLFLSHFEGEKDKTFSVEEMQLLEKIIVALKLKFQKTDIAKVNTYSKTQLTSELKNKNYSYVFLLGDEMAKIFDQKNDQKNEFVFEDLRFFTTFHPQDMIQNPDLKKDAWMGFKSIMETLPR